MKPVPAMPLCQQVPLLHQATFALESRKTSPRMRRLHMQQDTQIRITVYMCDLPPTLQVFIPADCGSVEA